MTRKILVLSLLMTAALSAHAAERLLTPPAYEALRARYSPLAVATDGTSYLAAWIATPYTRSAALMLQRLDAASSAPPVAAVIDSHLAFGRVDLVWSNGSYLLVWNQGFELHAMRVGRDGRPVAGSDRILATDLSDAVVASRGTATMLVAHTNFQTNDVVVLMLDELDRVVRRTAIWHYAGALYDVTATDNGFTAAISDWPGLFAFRFDAGGAQLGQPVTVMLSTGTTAIAYRPITIALASRGAETLFVWTAAANQSPYDLFAAILSGDGSVGARAALPHSRNFTAVLDAASDGNGYSVLFSAALPDTPEAIVRLYALRLNADGTPASAPLHVTSDTASIESSARLARGSAGYGVVWVASPGPSATTVYDRVEGAIAPELAGVAPLLLSRAVTEQSAPSIASNGSGYLVAWIEQSADHDRLFAAPLDHNGDPAGAPVLLFDRAAPSFPRPPRVAFSGGTYVVAWVGDGAVQAMRLDGAGRPLDARPLPLSGTLGADQQFDITPTPGGFFAVWAQSGSIYGAALTGPAATPPQKLTEHLPAPPHSVSGPFESEPHIAFNGQKFLLTYTSMVVTTCAFDIPCTTEVTWHMIRLDAAGRRETEPHALDATVLDVASDGRDFAVMGWDDLLRVDAQTLAVTGRAFVPSDRTPALLWNGTRYVAVTVLDEGTGAARVTAREITASWTLGSARAANVEPRFGSFDAAVNAAGDVFIAYERRIAEEPFEGAPRVAVQAVGDVAPGRIRATRP